VKLIAQVKLQPTADQSLALRETLIRANAAANAISQRAWEQQTFRAFALHKVLYHTIKAEFMLTAQVVVRVLAKVGDAYKLDHKRQRVFRPLGSLAYDDRILRWYPDQVSIWTIAGRQRIPFVCGERQRLILETREGESDLVAQDGQFYLLATCTVEEPESEATGWLGVDVGISNIAVTSDNVCHAGGRVRAVRSRNARLRRKLQAKGTKSAKRLLRKRKRRESRFVRNTNHVLSCRIVADAERTSRGIALEDLTGIRLRIRASKHQRAALHSWAFGQLQIFITYKARLAGVPVRFVDPAYSSQTCPDCGYCAGSNRQTRSRFRCGQCDLVGFADHVAARNLSCRVVVNQPYVSPSGRDKPPVLTGGN